MKEYTGIKIEKISEIIPLFENGKKTLEEVGLLLTPQRSKNTIARYVRTLREAGYEVKTMSKGKRGLII